ncbi:MAG: ATP-binding protein [bacterium]
MEDLSLHILDIVENSIRAKAKKVEIKISEELKKDLLTISIKDDGKGMNEEIVKKALDPFFTTKNTKKVGLGLSLLHQATKEAKGKFTIDSKPNKGTKITATFKYTHIDRKPLGNITQTMITLIAGNPQIDFLYEHRKGSLCYLLDTAKVKVELGDVPINTPNVINFIQKDIRDGLKKIG